MAEKTQHLQVTEYGRKNKSYDIGFVEIYIDNYGKEYKEYKTLWTELGKHNIISYLWDELKFYKCGIKLKKK